MIKRTARAESMILALDMIRKDLGEEALVISVRQVLAGPSWQVWKKPEVEVMAVRLEQGEHYDKNQIQSKLALSENNQNYDRPPNAKPAVPMLREANPVKMGSPAKVSPGIGNQYQKEDILAMLPGSDAPIPEMIQVDSHGAHPSFEDLLAGGEAPGSFKTTIKPEYIQPYAPPALLAKTYHSLRQHGIDDKLLQRAIRICSESLNPRKLNEESQVIESVTQQLSSVLRVQNEALNLMPRVVFVIGTSGVGKTSAIAKMVVHFTVDLRQRVGWICADTVKIGAIAEAKTYSETIGTPLRVVYSPEELGNAIENLRQEVDYIFVDTPAFNPQNEASVLEIGSILTAFPRRSTWLVIPASAREIDLQNALGAVSPFKPRCLLLTKLDETNNFSAVYNTAWRSQLPMAYFSFGSKVMNELIPARPETLVQAIFEGRFRV